MVNLYNQVTPDGLSNCTSTSIFAVDQDHPLRAQAETFIAEGFFNAHRATINNFMPQLFTLVSDSLKGETIKACLGVRPATETLFVEQYLDLPIDQTCPELAIERRYIAEIGNLVSNNRHATLVLFITAAISLHRAGYREMVFCATRKVATILKQVGAALYPIIEADGRRLGSSLGEWGRYYDEQPVVMRLNLASVVDLIEESPLLQKQYFPYRKNVAQLTSTFKVVG